MRRRVWTDTPSGRVGPPAFRLSRAGSPCLLLAASEISISRLPHSELLRVVAGSASLTQMSRPAMVQLLQDLAHVAVGACDFGALGDLIYVADDLGVARDVRWPPTLAPERRLSMRVPAYELVELMQRCGEQQVLDPLRDVIRCVNDRRVLAQIAGHLVAAAKALGLASGAQFREAAGLLHVAEEANRLP